MNPPRKNINARVPADVIAASRRALTDEGWTVEAAIVAFLATAAQNPQVLLKLIAANRPAPRQPGRPRNRAKD